jgi:hypothetical protein
MGSAICMEGCKRSAAGVSCAWSHWALKATVKDDNPPLPWRTFLMECALMALAFVQVSASPCSAQFLRSHQQRYLDKHCTMGKSTLHWPTHVVASQLILQGVRAASFTLPHWSSHLQQLSEQIKSNCPASACEGQSTRRQRQQALHTHTHTQTLISWPYWCWQWRQEACPICRWTAAQQAAAAAARLDPIDFFELRLKGRTAAWRAAGARRQQGACCGLCYDRPVTYSISTEVRMPLEYSGSQVVTS